MLNIKEIQTIEHDVVIIGAGGAGIRAAIECARMGIKTGITMNLHETELITKNELANRLKVSTRTISQWMSLRRLPHLKIGKSVRYDWRAVVSHLERHFGKGLPS